MWFENRDRIIVSRRTWLTGAFGVALVLLLVVPWQTRVRAPAVLQPAEFAEVFPSETGQIRLVTVKEGQRVAAGELLVELTSPVLSHELRLAKKRQELAGVRVSRSVADRLTRSEIQIRKREFQRETEAVQGLQERIAALRILATSNGHVTHLPDASRPGSWVGRDDMLLSIMADKPVTRIKAAIAENELSRIGRSTTAQFIPDDWQQPIHQATLTSVAPTASSEVPELYFSDQFGGQVPVSVDERGRHKPSTTIFSASFEVTDYQAQVQGQLMRESRGILLIDGEAQSYLTRIVQRVASVLIREAGA